MRIRQLIGVILIAFGAYVLIRGFTFTTKETVVDLGPIEARDERYTFQPWSGAVIGGLGLLMVVAGGRRRRA